MYSGAIEPPGTGRFNRTRERPASRSIRQGRRFIRYNTIYSGGFVAKINPGGSGFGFSPISFPATVTAITVDAVGDTYLATGGIIEKLNPTGTAVWTFTMPGIGDSSRNIHRPRYQR